jgi:effector-binding domain-containing protein
MFTEPKVEDRPEQHYAGIRTQITMDELGSGIIPQLHDETMAWLRARSLAPSGAPFLRYHVIDMACNLDIELAWPVAAPITGDGRVNAGTLPAGRYASLIYTGIANGVAGNGALLNWVQEQGLTLDSWSTPQGDAFRSRVEFEITNPADEPDMAKWETEVAIKLADGQG